LPQFRETHGIAPADFVVLYAGSMGLKQGLVKCHRGGARETAGISTGVKWILVGEGGATSTLRQLIVQHGLDGHVKLLPLQPEAELRRCSRRRSASAQPGWCGQAYGDSVEAADLHGCRKTDFSRRSNAESQGAELLRQATGGVVVARRILMRLAAAVVRLRGSDRQELADMGRRNRTFATQHFDRSLFVARQEAVLKSVVFPPLLASV